MNYTITFSEPVYKLDGTEIRNLLKESDIINTINKTTGQEGSVAIKEISEEGGKTIIKLMPHFLRDDEVMFIKGLCDIARK